MFMFEADADIPYLCVHSRGPRDTPGILTDLYYLKNQEKGIIVRLDSKWFAHRVLRQFIKDSVQKYKTATAMSDYDAFENGVPRLRTPSIEVVDEVLGRITYYGGSFLTCDDILGNITENGLINGLVVTLNDHEDAEFILYMPYSDEDFDVGVEGPFKGRLKKLQADGVFVAMWSRVNKAYNDIQREPLPTPDGPEINVIWVKKPA